MYNIAASLPLFLLDAIPFLPNTYLSAEAQSLVVQLYKIVSGEAKFLFKILLLITFGMSLFAGEKWSFDSVVKQAVFALCIYIALPFVFGATIKLGIGFANKIYDRQSAAQLSKDISDTAKNKRDQPNGGNSGTGNGSDTSEIKWYDYVLSIVEVTIPGPGQVTSFMMVLSTICFFVVTAAMNLLWTLLVAILFIMGPIPAVLATVPGWGGRILANWYGAVVQLAALRVWLAICAWVVDNSQILFLKHHFIFSFDLGKGNLEAIAINIIFVFLYLLGPILIARFFPLSNINVGITQGLLAGIVLATRIAKPITK